MISPYTPTLSTLLASPPCTRNDFKMMVVVQPRTPRYRTLPCTLDELCKIERHGPNQGLIKHGIPAALASEEVLSHLSAASIVHFTSHGEQDPHNPLESAIILENGRLKVSHIMEQPMPNASLAFLSACQTAMGDENLPDEAIHLAAALLFSGFRGAVATM